MCNPCNSVFFKLVAFGCASSPSHTKAVLTFAHKHTARSHALIYKLETVFVLLLNAGYGSNGWDYLSCIHPDFSRNKFLKNLSNNSVYTW